MHLISLADLDFSENIVLVLEYIENDASVFEITRIFFKQINS